MRKFLGMCNLESSAPNQVWSLDFLAGQLADGRPFRALTPVDVCARECLDAHWFTTLTEAKQVIEPWRREYNESRPHRALGKKTPNEFASQFAASRELTDLQPAENSLCG